MLASVGNFANLMQQNVRASGDRADRQREGGRDGDGEHRLLWSYLIKESWQRSGEGGGGVLERISDISDESMEGGRAVRARSSFLGR